jgi:hypothetical protein
MKAIFFLLFSITLFSCTDGTKSIKERPVIRFDRRNLTASIQNGHFTFKTIQFSSNRDKNLFVLNFANEDIDSVNLYDSLKLHLLNIDLNVLDTASYNILFKINSSKVFDYDLRYLYINSGKNDSIVEIIKELVM